MDFFLTYSSPFQNDSDASVVNTGAINATSSPILDLFLETQLLLLLDDISVYNVDYLNQALVRSAVIHGSGGPQLDSVFNGVFKNVSNWDVQQLPCDMATETCIPNISPLAFGIYLRAVDVVLFATLVALCVLDGIDIFERR